MSNTQLQPEVLKWARRRAGLTEAKLASKMEVSVNVLREWERTGHITLAKAEKLAQKTHTAVGYLFLNDPPQTKLPINDFRTVDDPAPVSSNLLEIIYEAQRRQEWYREHLIAAGSGPLVFVGKITIETPVERAAQEICETFEIGPRLSIVSEDWKANLLLHIEALEERGVLVMRGSNLSSARKFSVEDFRGFALCDDYAPVVFINSADSRGAQLFTLAHELVHIWIGESAVSNLRNTYAPAQRIESFCNAVAAEMLLPLSALTDAWNANGDVDSQIQRFSARYKVSTLVVLRRAKDAGFITTSDFTARFRAEFARLRALSRRPYGNWYSTMNARIGSRMARAIIGSALEGKTLYRDAMQLLGVKSMRVFQNFAQKMGFSA